MKKIIDVLKNKNLRVGYLYFYIHFVVEVLCFFVLARLVGDSFFLWFAPLFYDAFAFVPQSIIGYIYDKRPSVYFPYIGLFLLLVGFILFCLDLVNPYIGLLLVCLGNAVLHVDGACVTLKCSGGMLSVSAIFVAGGSFGVITGKLLGQSNLAFWFIVALGLSTIPFIILSHMYYSEASKKDLSCSGFDYADKNLSKLKIILLAVFIVIVRGYMGYGIPTSWNKTTIEAILLYSAMGIGKAFGGILSDSYGIRKTSVLSSLLALPFLIFGDNLMIVSLIGVMLFSMTMSVTLALLVSVLKHVPGLAFGLTTIGLFIGTVPIFFFRFTTVFSNSVVIVVFTLLCSIIFMHIIRRDEKC